MVLVGRNSIRKGWDEKVLNHNFLRRRNELFQGLPNREVKKDTVPGVLISLGPAKLSLVGSCTFYIPFAE